MSSIQNIGLQGMKQGFASAADNAEKITQAFTPDSSVSDPVEPIIGLEQAKRQVEASAKVIKVGNELDKEVLDILA